jgi:hypothetical protein|tara:strand:+ start:1402 stop:1620 length:219 start_codon:yes stop_codon:yes gene_type:complete
MFIATLETRHFSFIAAGDTEEQAIAALRAGWEEHARQTDATFTADQMVSDARINEVSSGQCLRDGEPLRRTP